MNGTDVEGDDRSLGEVTRRANECHPRTGQASLQGVEPRASHSSRFRFTCFHIDNVSIPIGTYLRGIQMQIRSTVTEKLYSSNVVRYNGSLS